MKFNGLLKTSVFRGDVPSEGVLVLRDGDGVLAEHRSSVDLAGRPAVPEILKDATSSRAQLEVRTYDYGHSSISIEQLQRSYPDASVDGIGDADALLTQVAAQEAAEREAYTRDLDVQRDQEKKLIEREEELYRRKWELEQESQRSGLRQRELDALRSELAAVKEASALIMQRLEARNASESVEVESQKKLLAMESSKAKAELEAQRKGLADRESRAASIERELAVRETALHDREAALDSRDGSFDRERKQANELYSSLQEETEKITEARKMFDARLAEAEQRERELNLREQSSREWEGKLREHDASLTERETALVDREKTVANRLRDLDAQAAKLRAEAGKVDKHAEAVEIGRASCRERV